MNTMFLLLFLILPILVAVANGDAPTASPRPSPAPSIAPLRPSAAPSTTSSAFPTGIIPTSAPTVTERPSPSPSRTPTALPTVLPSQEPTLSQTPTTGEPTASPKPSPAPTIVSSDFPSATNPSSLPSTTPSSSPSRITPTFFPSESPKPSPSPSQFPTITPQPSVSLRPSFFPSVSPSMHPSDIPSVLPTKSPYPTFSPSLMPSLKPSGTRSFISGPSNQPTFEYSKDAFIACFPSTMTVQVQNYDGRIIPKSMAELQLGELVQIPGGTWEPIYTFGHYHSTQTATFLQIQTLQNTTSILEISPDHMLYSSGKYIPASMLKVGDELWMNGDNEKTRIISITTTTRQGVYAPFTRSGTLLVNGIHVSTYVAMLDPLYFPNQWLAHAYESPHRWYCRHWNCLSESYNEDGISNWIAFPLRMVQWVTESSIRMVLLVPFMVLSVSILSMFDHLTLFCHIVAVLCLCYAIKQMRRRRR